MVTILQAFGLQKENTVVLVMFINLLRDGVKSRSAIPLLYTSIGIPSSFRPIARRIYRERTWVSHFKDTEHETTQSL